MTQPVPDPAHLSALQLTAVTEVLGDFYKAHLRLAGSVGALVVDEAVERGKIPVAADVSGYNDGVGTWAPVNVYDCSGHGIWKVRVSLEALSEDNHFHLASVAYRTISILREMNTDFWRGLQHIEFTHSKRLRWLSPNWMQDNDALEVLEIPPESDLVSVHECFLTGCSSLRQIDLSFLRNVTHIQERFLEGCSSLRELDLAPLKHVTKIGPNFMFGCASLVTLDLAPLWRLSEVPLGFLGKCSNLRQLDLSPLKGVSKIAWDFLTQCEKLEEVNVSSLTDVARIASSFLSGCNTLKVVDTRGMGTVVHTCGWRFLSRCDSIEEVHLDALCNITNVGWDFLSWCPKLVYVDLSPLANVTLLGESFMQGCSGLRTIDLAPLSNVEMLGGRFLSGCSSLEEVDLAPLARLQRINQGFMEGCASLLHLNLDALLNVKTVARNFLEGCVSLKEIDVSVWAVGCTIANENFARGVGMVIGQEGMMFVSSSDYLHFAEEPDAEEEHQQSYDDGEEGSAIDDD